MESVAIQQNRHGEVGMVFNRGERLQAVLDITRNLKKKNKRERKKIKLGRYGKEGRDRIDWKRLLTAWNMVTLNAFINAKKLALLIPRLFSSSALWKTLPISSGVTLHRKRDVGG